jgi:hypothetical protein
MQGRKGAKNLRVGQFESRLDMKVEMLVQLPWAEGEFKAENGFGFE